MRQVNYTILENAPLTASVYRIALRGDTSPITAPGQFVNLRLDGLYLRRPISVCDVDGDMLTLIYKVVGKGMFRITRNTDVEIEEDEADDLLQAVRDSVSRRQWGGVVRLEIESRMPANLSDYLVKKLHLKSSQVYTVEGPMAFSGFFALLDVNRPDLKDKPYYATFNPAAQMGNPDCLKLFTKDELDAIQFDTLEEEMSRSHAYDIVPDYDKAHDLLVEAKRTR